MKKPPVQIATIHPGPFKYLVVVDTTCNMVFWMKPGAKWSTAQKGSGIVMTLPPLLAERKCHLKLEAVNDLSQYANYEQLKLISDQDL